MGSNWFFSHPIRQIYPLWTFSFSLSKYDKNWSMVKYLQKIKRWSMMGWWLFRVYSHYKQIFEAIEHHSKLYFELEGVCSEIKYIVFSLLDIRDFSRIFTYYVFRSIRYLLTDHGFGFWWAIWYNHVRKFHFIDTCVELVWWLCVFLQKIHY